MLDNASRQILEEKKLEKVLAKYIDKIYFAGHSFPYGGFSDH